MVTSPAIVPDAEVIAPLEFEPLVSGADVREAILQAYDNEMTAEQDAAYFLGVCKDSRRLQLPNESIMKDSIVKDIIERAPHLESIIVSYIFQ